MDIKGWEKVIEQGRISVCVEYAGIPGLATLGEYLSATMTQTCCGVRNVVINLRLSWLFCHPWFSSPWFSASSPPVQIRACQTNANRKSQEPPEQCLLDNNTRPARLHVTFHGTLNFITSTDVDHVERSERAHYPPAVMDASGSSRTASCGSSCAHRATSNCTSIRDRSNTLQYSTFTGCSHHDSHHLRNNSHIPQQSQR